MSGVKEEIPVTPTNLETTTVTTTTPTTTDLLNVVLPTESITAVSSQKDTPDNETSSVLKIVLIAIALILFGVLIGVLASNIIPQNKISQITPTPTLTPEVTPAEPEITPSEEPGTISITINDQSIIDKFAGKKTTGGVVPNLIQKCNYKTAPAYSMTNTSVENSPSIIVDEKGKYVMTCGIEKKSDCDLISMCQEIYRQESETGKTSPDTSNYKCPSIEWIDCMPIVEESRKYQCEQPYLDWATANCPNFKGAAY